MIRLNSIPRQCLAQEVLSCALASPLWRGPLWTPMAWTAVDPYGFDLHFRTVPFADAVWDPRAGIMQKTKTVLSSEL